VDLRATGRTERSPPNGQPTGRMERSPPDGWSAARRMDGAQPTERTERNLLDGRSAARRTDGAQPAGWMERSPPDGWSAACRMDGAQPTGRTQRSLLDARSEMGSVRVESRPQQPLGEPTPEGGKPGQGASHTSCRHRQGQDGLVDLRATGRTERSPPNGQPTGRMERSPPDGWSAACQMDAAQPAGRTERSPPDGRSAACWMDAAQPRPDGRSAACQTPSKSSSALKTRPTTISESTEDYQDSQDVLGQVTETPTKIPKIPSDFEAPAVRIFDE
jgi:hypothetical protein